METKNETVQVLFPNIYREYEDEEIHSKINCTVRETSIHYNKADNQCTGKHCDYLKQVFSIDKYREKLAELTTQALKAYYHTPEKLEYKYKDYTVCGKYFILEMPKAQADRWEVMAKEHSCWQDEDKTRFSLIINHVPDLLDCIFEDVNVFMENLDCMDFLSVSKEEYDNQVKKIYES